MYCRLRTESMANHALLLRLKKDAVYFLWLRELRLPMLITKLLFYTGFYHILCVFAIIAGCYKAEPIGDDMAFVLSLANLCLDSFCVWACVHKLQKRNKMKSFKILIGCTGILMLGGCVSTSGGYSSDDGFFAQTQAVLNSDTANNLFGMFGMGQSANVSVLSEAEVGAALREALKIGTGSVVSKLGVENGFNLDPTIHIPLPEKLATVDKALSKIGMNGLTEDLELRLNRAAEQATPKAKALFFEAISQMTFADAKNILTGPNDAATSYLRKTMGAGLAREMQPVVQDALTQAGAIRAYDSVMGQYAQLPFMPDVKADLQNYVVERALDGVFYYVAQEEAAIRENPAKRTTELLQKVFGAMHDA